ncbi:aldo/keto reductase family protein [Bifidobacterium amazonense]|uniref:Voltage-gated potassium channel n=2 Tax=Bifidobacterium TaxID=1678 RepID=A0A086ZLX2_9BIFI|nr:MULTISPECIES: aldo/keto reductase family protein [Bifidobacterium]KFI47522.1 voltage-gated potassium channel [Bifidobacterium biavatii DSM 23969]MCH9274818.1 aldo/keto reductase family protein [Bifidobacterium amazonense]
MKYRNVGKAGIKVSEIALGSWMTRLEDTAAVDNAMAIADAAFDAGVNFYDCADAYSGGDAERFLGRFIAKHDREDVVISSKVFFGTGKSVNGRGLSRKHIFNNCERSLKNLGTDYIDLYYCHRFDTTTPLEETLQALSDLVDQGKILYYGVSEEWSAARLERAERIISERGLHPLTVVQPQYNMVDRYIEHEIVETCERYGIGITPFSPLAQGLLTGKYRKGQPLPAGSRATWQSDHQINNLLTDENLDKVERLSKIADELGVKMPVLALAWILRLPVISSVIVGASKPSQLESNIAASGVEIPADALKQIDDILGFKRFERHIG